MSTNPALTNPAQSADPRSPAPLHAAQRGASGVASARDGVRNAGSSAGAPEAESGAPWSMHASVAEYFSAQSRPPATPRQGIQWEIGDIGREILERLVDTKAPDEELASAAAQLEAVAAHLRRFDHGRRYGDQSYWDEDSDGRPATGHIDYSPVIGRSNPIAPNIAFEFGPDGVTARLRFGSAYEGPPGCVHGGMLASVFDETMGVAQSVGGSPGMTASLTVDYRSPVPLHSSLICRARLDRTEGRKLFTTATLHRVDPSDGTEILCAEARGLFISIDFAQMAEKASNGTESVTD